jgi:phytoene dehydrogenase-like protein
MQTRDAVIVGAGHNGLVAATLLARAGWSVRVLERSERIGGAAVSERIFPGVEARLSRYSYLVSLFPRRLRDELGLSVELRPREGPDTRSPELVAWHERMARLAERAAPTLLQPLRSREEFRLLVDDEQTWSDVFGTPLGVALERELSSDEERGAVLTDALIGTFAPADDPQLRQNRCFLYHVIGDGRGSWDVPVGGMGRITDQLAGAARRAGAEILCGREAERIETDGRQAEVACADGSAHRARHVLCGAAPAVLRRLLGAAAPGTEALSGAGAPAAQAPEGSQLKINLLVSRLPRLRDPGVSPRSAFARTLHVNEGYEQLQVAYREAAAGFVPALAPLDVYCHSLTDPSILGEDLRARGAHALTVFGLHMPARLFGGEHDVAKRAAVEAALASLNSVLAEPVEDCLMKDGNGEPCLEALTPVEIERELAMPGGHIFHRDLSWPFAESADEVGRWGVETELPNVWLCGAGARRGGGVSGIPGHNAARAVISSHSDAGAGMMPGTGGRPRSDPTEEDL